MIDDVFTYGGQGLGFVAIGLWAWLAMTAPALQAWILARYEDELGLGASPSASAPARSARMGLVAGGVTMVALLCQSIGFAIPD
ncbi:hypothetical protein FV222_14710 [Methylobacterium sp. WL103]|uniref:hypothetical protein n=1 Tax=unclassified Methylobacterium TaxID=2615210 RepID=UPI0011CA63A9|nr:MULTISPECIES: hypothetical protein [unclassified Methylobacterium]TXM66379.1 hypothetical protein FV229_12940 [Methylobacterium sp. WL120]TXM72966.1 hypothetical protein FV226_10735 [Methylobacterium sp. WL12]TXM98249.1 hypothetical protein FV222_14710 [Methylobacterium sp. WL103]